MNAFVVSKIGGCSTLNVVIHIKEMTIKSNQEQGTFITIVKMVNYFNTNCVGRGSASSTAEPP